MLKDENGNIISHVINYKNEEENKEVDQFIIIGNEQMLAQFKNNFIDPFFMDCTYRAVPPNKYKYRLMVIVGYDLNKKKTVLCSFILLKNEKEKSFKLIFEYLHEHYSFNPRRIMCDFNLAQINAVKNTFPECIINTCFFHFSQAIWKNFRKYDFCGKGTYNDNNELLFNIQLMCFIDRDNIVIFYKDFKKVIKIKISKFF